MQLKVTEGSKLIATIRKESKYYYQQPLDKNNDPVPFEVELVFSHNYCVRGNNNEYTLYDVQLYVAMEGAGRWKLAMHNIPW